MFHVEQYEVFMIIEKEKFCSLFAKNGFDISSEVYSDFYNYSELQTEWNEKINLTAITDPEGITVKHFLDSLLLMKYTDIKEKASLIDVGTGAGFPGIPLKIFRRDISLIYRPFLIPLFSFTFNKFYFFCVAL